MRVIRAALAAALLAPALASAQTATGGIVYPPLAPPTTVAASATATSAVQPSYGYPRVTAAISSTQASTLCIRRFVDNAGLQPLETATRNCVPTDASGNAGLGVADGAVFGSFVVLVTNNGASTATITAVNPGWVGLGTNLP